jgi:hypothetical protein
MISRWLQERKSASAGMKFSFKHHAEVASMHVRHWGISENIFPSRAFLSLTDAVEKIRFLLSVGVFRLRCRDEFDRFRRRQRCGDRFCANVGFLRI